MWVQCAYACCACAQHMAHNTDPESRVHVLPLQKKKKKKKVGGGVFEVESTSVSDFFFSDGPCAQPVLLANCTFQHPIRQQGFIWFGSELAWFGSESIWFGSDFFGSDLTIEITRLVYSIQI